MTEIVQTGLCNSTVTGKGEFAGYSPYDLWENTAPAERFRPSPVCSSTNQAPGCRYEDELFTTEAVNYIQNYNSKKPLALTLSFHSVHTPLQPPVVQAAKFSFINDTVRQNYAAMTNLMDQYVGQVVNVLKAKNMYENTFILMLSDNGGAIHDVNNARSPGGNNYPLKGGKFSNWEGGARVNVSVCFVMVT